MGGGIPIEPKEVEVIVAPKEGKFSKWWKKLVYEEYHITIWFVAAKEVDADGGTSYKRVPKKYKAVKINKVSPKLIKFIDLEKRPVEIRSEEPMNWDLIKVY